MFVLIKENFSTINREVVFCLYARHENLFILRDISQKDHFQDL